MKEFIIQFNSKVNIFVNNEKITEINVDSDTKVIPNSLILINNEPACILDDNFIKQINEHEYNLYCWWQGHYKIENGILSDEYAL